MAKVSPQNSQVNGMHVNGNRLPGLRQTASEKVEANGKLERKVSKQAASQRAGKPVYRKRRAFVSRPTRLALALTVGMGIAIPLLSLSLSTVAGTLARTGHTLLAGCGLLLTASVLTVSLAHLAWAVGDITRSARWASWLLAVTVDLAIVLCETVHVFAPDAGINVLCTGIMVCVCLTSMALNVWAFCLARHQG